jgi:hypothetical protein
MAEDRDPRATSWQPVDTAPYGSVLAWVAPPDCSVGWPSIAYKDDEDRWRDSDSGLLDPYIVTHWMPLPEAPQ